MDILLNSLQYTIPSVVVMLTAYLLIKQYFDKEIRQQKHELLMNNQKLITPIRLQAYERLTLLLERISPENLLTRVYVQGMTAKEFKLKVILEMYLKVDTPPLKAAINMLKDEFTENFN
ncbi:MAG: hypothetical protein B6I20_06140 [Bacteroidetes bacterium 4572_117]|nr:MAG: hypothetical protein B6I20_06140 [Bacteroidetes bacterium 4572_117]